MPIIDKHQGRTPNPSVPRSGSLRQGRDFQWASVQGRLHPERVQALDRFLVGNTVLDAGCGGGGYVGYLAARGLDVTGVDHSAELVTFAQKHHPGGKFFHAPLTQLPFADASFDTVYCFDVLEHLDDRAAVLELARVARARLILCVPQTNSPLLERHGFTFLTYQDPTHLRYYTQASLASLVQLADPVRFEIAPEVHLQFKSVAVERLHFRTRSAWLNWVLTKAYRRLVRWAESDSVYAGFRAVVDLAPARGSVTA